MCTYLYVLQINISCLSNLVITYNAIFNAKSMKNAKDSNITKEEKASKEIQDNQDCPCCSGSIFKDCCKPIILEDKTVATPLALMRSRFTAHILNDIGHILKTMKDKALKMFDREQPKENGLENVIGKN